MNIECPSCGAPAPLNIASPDELHCPSCGFVGPMPQEARDALRRGAERLRALGTKQMQLGGLARRSLLNARFHIVVLLVVALIVGAPLAVMELAIFAGASWSPSTGFEIRAACALPMVLYLLTVVLGALWIGRVRRKLLAASAATPPAVAGQPAHCRLCGAPLVTGAGAIVRCQHCSADNLVSPAAFVAASARRASDLYGIEASIRGAGATMRSAARQVVFALFATLVGAPIATFCLTFSLLMVFGSIEAEVDDTVRYTIVETPAGRCIGQVNLDTDYAPVWISFGGDAEDGYVAGIARESTDGLTIVHLRDLVGLRVREHAAWHREGTIVRVHGTRMGENCVVLRPSGESLYPPGLCVVP